MAATARSCAAASSRTTRAAQAVARSATRPASAGSACAPADDHPWPIDEQAPVRRRVARGLEPGHRVPADEPQAGGIGPAEDRALGAGDVGHDGGRWQRLAPRTRQRIDELQAGGRRRGQDHEVGVGEGGLGRRRREIDDAIGGRLARALAARRPGGHRPVAGRRSSRTARAIDPRSDRSRGTPSRMSASIAAATVPGQAWPGSRRIAPGARDSRGSMAQATAATSRAATPMKPALGEPALVAAASVSIALGSALGRLPLAPVPGSRARSARPRGVGRRTRVVGRVRASMVRPALRLSTLLPQERAAARAATFLGEERFERRDGVDLATAGPAGESGHRGSGSDLGQARQRGLDLLERVLVVLERAVAGIARTPTGRNDRARTG